MRSFESLSRIGKASIPVQGVITCLFLCFCFTTAFTIFETTGPIYTTINPYLKFNVFTNSLMFLAISAVSLASLLILQALLYWFNDFLLMIVFSFVLSVGVLILYDWNGFFINLIRLSIGIGLVSMGYAIGSSLLMSIFTKILEKKMNRE